MNFKQWCDQISKELGTKIHREDVYKVMYMAFRVAMEEFAIRPDDAELFIHGFGRFYLNVERHRNYIGEQYGQEPYQYIRTIHFTPSRRLKDIIRGRYKLEDMAIGRRYLFPEYHIDEDGQLYNNQGVKEKINLDKKREMRHPNSYWIKQIEKLEKGQVVLNNDGSFSKVDRRRKVPVYEKRGRPALKLTPSQARTKALKEMRRDLRREKRNQRKALEQQQREQENEQENEQQLWRELEEDKTRKGSEPT